MGASDPGIRQLAYQIGRYAIRGKLQVLRRNGLVISVSSVSPASSRSGPIDETLANVRTAWHLNWTNCYIIYRRVPTQREQCNVVPSQKPTVVRMRIDVRYADQRSDVHHVRGVQHYCHGALTAWIED